MPRSVPAMRKPSSARDFAISSGTFTYIPTAMCIRYVDLLPPYRWRGCAAGHGGSVRPNGSAAHRAQGAGKGHAPRKRGVRSAEGQAARRDVAASRGGPGLPAAAGPAAQKFVLLGRRFTFQDEIPATTAGKT